MTKQEIEKAIENGESVWVALDDKVERLVNLEWFTDDVVKSYNMDKGVSHMITRDYFNHLYKTKAEAEHYLYHANVTRTETLPFLTWEEFKEERYLGFYSIYNEWIDVYVTNGLEPDKKIITIENATKEEFLANYDLTETNFYKAYDECVRLFKRGENENIL